MKEFNPNIDQSIEQLKQLEEEARRRKPIDQVFKIFKQHDTPIVTKLDTNT